MIACRLARLNGSSAKRLCDVSPTRTNFVHDVQNSSTFSSNIERRQASFFSNSNFLETSFGKIPSFLNTRAVTQSAKDQSEIKNQLNGTEHLRDNRSSLETKEEKKLSPAMGSNRSSTSLKSKQPPSGSGTGAPGGKRSRKKAQDFDIFGTWDSTTDLPLLVEASIAQGRPIPAVLASSVGASSVRGRRPYQEDQFCIEELGENLLYFAVFDGHGGSECSRYCAQHMHRHISYRINKKMRESEEEEDTKELDLTAVLHNAFLEVNNSFSRWYSFNTKVVEGDSSGTTATVVLLKDSTKVAIGHVGDSRAVLCRGGEARKLTTDHVPCLITEKNRIEKSGGRVKDGRVNDRLAMTRSIGDLELKRYGVIAEPEVRLVNISHSRDAFVVLTTDGINSVMTDQEIVDTVKQAEDPTIAAHLLTDTAVQYSSEDNSTAIVIPLGSWGKYSAAATIFHSFGKSFTSSSRFG